MTTTDSRNRFMKMRATMRLPVVCAPMFLVSGPGLVLAACRAGIVGSFPNQNARSIDIFEEWLDRITGELAFLKKNQEKEPGTRRHKCLGPEHGCSQYL